MKPSCEDCKFYNGQKCCIRSTPGGFPNRSTWDWCGEHQPAAVGGPAFTHINGEPYSLWCWSHSRRAMGLVLGEPMCEQCLIDLVGIDVLRGWAATAKESVKEGAAGGEGGEGAGGEGGEEAGGAPAGPT